MAHLPLSRPLASPFAVPLTGAVAACSPKAQLSLLQRVFGVWRQRQQLDRLPAHMRADIGLSDVEITRETQRPLWDVPQTWRC